MAALPIRLEIDVCSPHGAPVTGASVKLVGGGAECQAAEGEAGVYKASLRLPDDSLLIIEGAGRPASFDYRAFRAVLFFAQQPGGGARLVAMEQPDGERARFFTVGSCNINDRGFEFEGELNLAVVDAELARRLRVELWRSHLGGDARITGDIEGDIAVWREHAERNRSYDPVSGSPPEGHVFPFVPRAERTFLFGHDVF